jgi:hypothetical protein
MAIQTLFGKKAAAAAVAALTLGAGMTMNAGEAEARYGRKGLIAAGVIGALATAAIVGSANRAEAYDDGYAYAPHPGYAPAPVYYHQQPRVQVYHHPHYGYHHQPRVRRYHGYQETGYAYRGPVCKIRKQRVWDGWGWQVQRVEVCR